MTTYKTGDVVEAIEVLGGGGIAVGTRGKVLANAGETSMTVRVAFKGDPGVNYRVVPKGAIRRA